MKFWRKTKIIKLKYYCDCERTFVYNVDKFNC